MQYELKTDRELLVHIAGKLDSVSVIVDDHEARLRSVERWRWRLAGVLAGAVVGVNVAMKLIWP